MEKHSSDPENGQTSKEDVQKTSSSVDEIHNLSDSEKTKATAPAAKKESWPKRILTTLNLDLITLQLMFKGALAPTISIAIYQSSFIAAHFSTLGYLIAIMSILSLPIMPRAKFVMTMFLNVLGVCVGSAFALLAIYSSVQARKHTSPPVKPAGSGDPTSGQQTPGYNSSASAVCAIWLIFNIYAVNTLRAARPQLQLPVIMYSIFAMVSSTYAPGFPTMAVGIAFVKRLLEAFLLGFAIAFGVSIFIFPKTCRGIFFLQCGGMIKVIQGLLAAQKGYIQSLESRDVFDPAGLEHKGSGNGPTTRKGSHNLFHKDKPKPPPHPEAAKLKALVSVAGELQGKIAADMNLAKRELAYGKLGPEDIDAIHKLFQGILLPIYGMSSIADIFSRVADRLNAMGECKSEGLETDQHQMPKARVESMQQWNHIMKKLRVPFEVITQAMVEGLQHAAFTLELEKPPKKQKKDGKDVEANAASSRPGDPNFSKHLRTKINDFYASRQSTLKAFLEQDKIDANPDGPKSPLEYLKEASKQAGGESDRSPKHLKAHRQLFMILYVSLMSKHLLTVPRLASRINSRIIPVLVMVILIVLQMEFLLWSTGQAVLKLAEFADEKVQQGVMKRSRIINPGGKRLRKLFFSVFESEDVAATEHTPDSSESGSAGIYAGASYSTRKDPEHLPPENFWEKSTDALRTIARLFRSESSSFGFRVACATFTIGIVAYLEKTQTFFRNQRLVWAMIMVAIGMTTTAGAGIFGFVGRVGGTVIAMCTSLIIWYIVVGHTVGVIMFLFAFTFVEFYFIIKTPRLTVIALLSIVTQVLIIGYELQVQQVGIKSAESNGQPYYRTALLAPYRLACVVGGMFVAFIWTFFPFPLTERSQLRKDLGASLYLLANYYSVVHTTVSLRVQGKEGNLSDKESPGHKLEKARRQLWDKEMALIAGLRQHSQFVSWEPTFGGRFPKECYNDIIDRVASMVNYLALIAYASATFTRLNASPTDPSNPARVTMPSSSDQPTKSTSRGDGDFDANPMSTTPSATWFADFSKLIHSIGPTSQEITSCLTLLSAALTGSMPLPPYMKPPPAYDLSLRLQAMDDDVLSIRHVQEPGYAAFAVMQVASSVVRDDLENLIDHVRTLVGEVDFSFHIHSSNVSGSEETLWEKTEHSRYHKTQPGGVSTGSSIGGGNSNGDKIQKQD